MRGYRKAVDTSCKKGVVIMQILTIIILSLQLARENRLS